AEGGDDCAGRRRQRRVELAGSEPASTSSSYASLFSSRPCNIPA
ncbi:Os03g0739500, partial [Oryza sativa Japonica Group]